MQEKSIYFDCCGRNHVCRRGGLSLLAHYYTLNGIKSRTVGDGQHMGTARFATKKKFSRPTSIFRFVKGVWRKGQALPAEQGVILGSTGKKK